MSTESITLEEALFGPRGIAIIGARTIPPSCPAPARLLLRLGYRGTIVPVNPTRAEVQGVRSYRSLADAPGPVDLAIVVVPSTSVVQALRDCAAGGAKAAIVFASGFAEMGGEGTALQEQIETVCRSTGLRVIGPNCLGTFALPSRAFATFSSAFDEQIDMPDDPIALASQSGAVGTFIFASMAALGVGVRYYANTGNRRMSASGKCSGTSRARTTCRIFHGLP